MIKNIELSGKFFSTGYEGSFNETGKWCNDFELDAKYRGMNINKWNMCYTTCPKRVKKYGKNYVVIFGYLK